MVCFCFCCCSYFPFYLFFRFLFSIVVVVCVLMFVWNGLHVGLFAIFWKEVKGGWGGGYLFVLLILFDSFFFQIYVF